MRNISCLLADILDQALYYWLYPLSHSEIRRPDGFMRRPRKRGNDWLRAHEHAAATKKPFSVEKGFCFTREWALLRQQGDALLVESAHLTCGELDAVALAVHQDPLVLQVRL